MASGNHSQAIRSALQKESEQYQEYYAWLEAHMPAPFFKELTAEHVILVAHNLMVLHLQDFFSVLQLKQVAFVLSKEGPDADIKVLKHFRRYGIKHYRTYVSAAPLPLDKDQTPLRISAIYFTEAIETSDQPIPADTVTQLRPLVGARNPDLTNEDFAKLVAGINARFLRSLRPERLALAIEMFFRAESREFCQYEVIYDDAWQKDDVPSMYVVLAWKNTQKEGFLYRLAQLVNRHGLVMKQANATYIDPFSPDSILLMGVGLHGQEGQAAWDAANIPDFLREMAMLKYFPGIPRLDATFINSGLLSGNLGNLLQAIVYFVHQIVVQVDPYLYSLDNVVEAICRHPELTVKLCEAFELRMHPEHADLDASNQLCRELVDLVDRLDTGHQTNDLRRKNVLKQGVNFVQNVLKTNYYRKNKSSLSFRLDPRYLDHAPFDRKALFPELPFAIFFIKGLHYMGFHIRFRDLSRGGLRTVFPERHEDMLVERNHVFRECYNLAYTQQKKNKDIPEGGAKGVIFLEPYDTLAAESEILQNELQAANFPHTEIQTKVATFIDEQKQEYLHATQRSYVIGLLTLINCEPDGTLRAKHILDYYKKPEYLYLGPDEKMHDSVILWIAQLSKRYGYRPGVAFISSKPGLGINHKEYGVTSIGVNVYMEQVLRYMGINPVEDAFTLKVSGGPDGDVAGNQLLNLLRYYPNTAKLLALTDVSGTIRDPLGLDLQAVSELFYASQPINQYPPEALAEGGFLLDRRSKRDLSPYIQQTLCWKKDDDQLIKDWLSGSDTHRLFSLNVHQTETDMFIPAGGRPRALNRGNLAQFLTPGGKPTSRAIVEGANLYLSQEARRGLEERGVLIIKDSSANKCGVICSSFEVLCGLVLSEEELLEHKEELVGEILDTLRARALDEASLLLNTHQETGDFLSDLSDQISAHINQYTDQLMDYLKPLVLPRDLTHPLMKAYLAYCLPFLRTHYQDRLLELVPEVHKKAIVASYIAARLVYAKGLAWSPSIVDILPIIWEDPSISS